MKHYNEAIKHNEEVELETLQKELTLLDNYRYHLNDLNFKYYQNKQKLINETYKKHQNNLLKEKLKGMTDKKKISVIKTEHYENDILYKRKEVHRKEAQLLKKQKNDFNLKSKNLLKEEILRKNNVRDVNLKNAKNRYHQNLIISKRTFII